LGLGLAAFGIAAVIMAIFTGTGVLIPSIGWIFYNEGKSESSFKGADEGIVIYFQNWKKVLANAAKSTLIVVVVTFLVTLVVGGLFYGLLSLFSVGRFAFIAFVASFILAITVKTAILDSYVMVQMIHTYMTVAPSTEIKFDLYDKLSKLSKSFRELICSARNRKTPSYPFLLTPAALGGEKMGTHTKFPEG
jgi:hypothetical protein